MKSRQRRRGYGRWRSAFRNQGFRFCRVRAASCWRSARFSTASATRHFSLVVSSAVLEELVAAPEQVSHVLSGIASAEVVECTEEANELRDAYLAAGVVGPASKRDAEHIAIASVAGVDMIVSWNFRHIVHYEKIAGYLAVNMLHGYPCPHIYSPKEVAPQ